MVLNYRFKKERLENGQYAMRPRIDVVLKGSNDSVEIPALIDSGCDTTVVPEGLARVLGINMGGEKGKLYGHRESADIVVSKATITFLGKANRESVVLNQVPILITLSNENYEDEDVVLGVQGIFDAFDITFKKSQNKIILKKSFKTKEHIS